MTRKPLTANYSDVNRVSATEITRYLKLNLKIPRALKAIANQKIIEQTAITEDISITEQELQIAADRFRFDHNLMSSQATVDWLNKYCLSVTEFEELIKNQLLAQKLAQHLFANRVEAYFYAHQLDYYQAVIYEVILSDFNLAMELFYAAQEQELSFWDLAHQYIQDKELRRRSGYLGKKNRGQLLPEIAAAVFSLTADSIPQILKPISINKKTHLIYVEEIIQPTLDQPLRQSIINQLFEDWLREKRC